MPRIATKSGFPSFWYPTCLCKCWRPLRPRYLPQKRCLLTLAIETSCDDTSVAIVEKTATATTLHFHEKITSDNREFGGIHPATALKSHQKTLSPLVQKSLQSLPEQKAAIAHLENALLVQTPYGGMLKKRPDFVTVTRGPGMRSNLSTGIDTAKGLAAAWQVPLLGVNHMQAHALTPRLVHALQNGSSASEPSFPFMTLLVSGGHTMLVQSLGLCDHRILAEAGDLAIGDVLDKVARDILSPEELDKGNGVMYGALLEDFAFPGGEKDYEYTAPLSERLLVMGRESEAGYSWVIQPPFSPAIGTGQKRRSMEYSFSGIGSKVKAIMSHNPTISIEERRTLAREAMRVSFEHLISRLLLALGFMYHDCQDITAVVISGGVASNQYLNYITRSLLDSRGLTQMEIVTPPIQLCTDNAAMIAWTGIEMWEAGHRSTLGITPLRKWTIDPSGPDGGILGVDGWEKA